MNSEELMFINNVKNLSNCAKIVFNYVMYEYKIACKYNLNSDNYYFSNAKNIQKYTGLSGISITLALKELLAAGFIEIISNIKNTKAQWFIITFNLAEKYFIYSKIYDENLIKNDLIYYSTMPPVYTFDETTVKMKNFIEKHSSKTVPTVSYMIMQAFKDMFERTHPIKFLDIPNVWQQIKNYLEQPNYKPNEIHHCIDEIAYNYDKKYILN